MKPTRLQLRNFMSYENADLDLSDVSLAVIVGPNGAGKSTILQAITYALWGEVRTSSHNDVVRRGCGSCAVSLDFAALGSKYRVTRRRDISGRGSSDLELSELDAIADLPLPMTASTIKETQEKIDGVVGMSYDAFAASALLQQGEASRFSDARPGERKELLAEMLGLGWFQVLEQKARIHARDIEYAIGITNSQLDSWEREVGSNEDPQERINELELEIENLKGARAFVDTELEMARELVAEIVAVNSGLQEAQNLMSTYKDRLDELEEDLKRLLTEQEEMSGVVDQKDEILALKELFDARVAERDMLIQAAKDFDRITDRIGQLEVSVGVNEQYVSSRDNAREKIEVAEQRLTEQEYILQELEDDVTDEERELNHLSVELAREDALENQLIARKLMLEGNSMCPTCGQEIEDPVSILEEISGELDRVGARIELLKEEENSRIDRVGKYKDEIALVEERILEINKMLSNYKTTLAISETKVELLESTKQELASATAERDALGFDQDLYDELDIKIFDMGDVDGLCSDLRYALSRQDVLSADIAETRKRIEKGQSLVEEGKGKLCELTEKANSMPTKQSVEGKIANMQSHKATLDNEILTAEKEHTRLEEIQRRLTELAESIKTTRKEASELERKKGTADLLVKATSKTGAQALLIEAALPQIEVDANEYLDVMARDMKLALMSQRQTQKGTASETLDIVVYSDGQQAPIETLSGGERFRADLSLRLAIGRLLSRRSNAKIEMLAIDEGFGSQDADGQEAITEVINTLTTFFPLILVISHVASIAETIGSTGNKIVVTKHGNKSIITLEK